jgi:uncharacterized membrane protein YoaK (UPF0700 family)
VEALLRFSREFNRRENVVRKYLTNKDYLTGMITNLIPTEAEKYASEVVPPPMRAPDPKMRLLGGIWAAFVLGAGTGAAMVLHFKALGMLGAALLLIVLILRNWKGAQMTETS